MSHGGKHKSLESWGRHTAAKRYACGGMADGGKAFTGKGPFGGSEQDWQDEQSKASRQKIFQPSQAPSMVSGSMNAPEREITEDERKIGK